MSVVITDAKIPKSCFDCWALDDNGDYPRCRITQTQKGYNFPTREKRMDDCPLTDGEKECEICNKAMQVEIRKRVEHIRQAENKSTGWHYSTSTEPCPYP